MIYSLFNLLSKNHARDRKEAENGSNLYYFSHLTVNSALNEDGHSPIADILCLDSCPFLWTKSDSSRV